MIKESNKIIVKVGDKSSLQLANSKVYRAITVKEMELLAEKHTDCHIVIIESIDENEQESIKKFATSFKNANDKNDVLFFIPKNDEITSGIADELDYNIYLTDREIYNKIYEQFGFSTSIYLDDRRRLLADSNIPEDIAVFGDEADFENILEESDTESEQTAKDNEIEQQISDDNITKYNEATEKDLDIDSKSFSDAKNSLDIEEEQPVAEETEPTEHKEVEQTEAVKEEITEQTLVKEETEQIEQTEKVVNNLTDTDEEIKNLKMKLRDANSDYNDILADMKKANTRIKSLEDVVRILKDEKESIIKRYDELVVSEDVLEDPISLSEYSKIKESAEQFKSKISELESTISALNNTIEHNKSDLEEKNKTISELKDSEKNAKDELERVNNSIASGEAFANEKDQYEKNIALERDKYEEQIASEKENYEKQLADVTSEKDEANKSASEALAKINELNSEISKLTDNVSKLTTEKEAALSEISDLKVKLTKSENEVNSIRRELESVQFENDENKNLVKQQNARIGELEKSNVDIIRKAELDGNSALEKKNSLETQITKLEAQLKVARQQLEQKEQQYNNLVSKSGVDASGASGLLETNKTLENISKTLREQLASATSELEVAKSRESDAQTQIRSLKTQVERLQSNLEMVSGSSKSSGIDDIPPINYRGRTQIISVFGSGSFGITTTAMSLAAKLSSTSKVLYIDFDMLSPMADSWFSINPMVNGIPGLNNNDTRNSGLGIFYEYGIDIFSKNIDRIIKCYQKTKGGGLHYLSGIYYHIDKTKIVRADYASLFNILADNFQYIIIDFGKLGLNDLNDSLIKNVSNISYKSIIVTTTNYFEIRNFRQKLNYNDFYTDRFVWLLNMCQKSAIDKNVQNLIKPCIYDIMPKVEQYQQNELFTRNIATKDRFGMFIDRYVFSK